jgi:hypothetical protein
LTDPFATRIFEIFQRSAFHSTNDARTTDKGKRKLDFDRIKVNRTGGHAQSFMITDEIVGTVEPGKKYRIGLTNLVPTDVEVSESFKQRGQGQAPANVRFRGSWITTDDGNATDSNILGGSGTLQINQTELCIPEIVATAKNLSFYGAKLVQVGDIIEFETNALLPVTLMRVGSAYVEHYLKVENKGGGAYIEYHDRPHLHVPTDKSATGCMIIGRSLGDEYILSAFKIPFGYGIYTPPNLLHADAFLVGNFLVVYSVTDHFSTVIFRSPDHQLVDLHIVAS